MCKCLYTLSEGELDEMFYERVAERVTGFSFDSPKDYRLRQGSNWKTTLAAARMFLAQVRHWSERQDIGVILAVDNDRCPDHPGAKPYPKSLPASDRKKGPRYRELLTMVHDALGPDPSKWPVDVALAVPVEMIESWVLTLLDPSQVDNLPIFAESGQRSAVEYHGKNPPPQLKELRDAAAKEAREGLFELFWRAAESDLQAAAEASLSFSMFTSDLSRWRDPRGRREG